ncbi:MULTISPECIES: LysM-like peptidoglycan-binding domain-containing protein [unclassified Brenneria]|uniref:OapA family protein n=1 Tax=unclassified Brenneria TaxID=2634434 RepID=UPI0029C4388D|nr:MULTISPECIES: LysM-like peptidoglycan-binding domain-containing protein [unclassified Brenneria]MDX5628813.1 LysM-like peptidoglycan-binding domain-containing protein [Brenneria sp. L3-3Z]MDX5695952.1 LysM-like peptidoglycan-binding domain-containing protein [Brenneria sp. L4-2C]MEE3661242.1 LysM-like peptidoglycan-binding domain-containing protein [Brenneria sp. g21c3]
MQPSSGLRIKAALQKIWHLPDSYHWMEPLPPFHRRWMWVAAGIVLVAILWPYSPPPAPPPQSRPVADAPSAPMQAEVVENSSLARQAPAVQPAQPAQSAPQNVDASWRNYEISSGQTLAQLFRDNNLPVSDVFAMAQAEGDDKPLSNLRAGQHVKLQLNAQGAVTALEIETTGNQLIRFTRNADGGFTRSR